MRWNLASLLWLLWALAGLAMEITALAMRRPQNTLSEQVWHLEGHGFTFARFVVLVFLGWLTVHLPFKLIT